MPDVWTRWDERVKECGRFTVAASELSDLELVTLLANDAPDRREEKRILKHEAYRRMVHDESPANAPERPRVADPDPAVGARFDPF